MLLTNQISFILTITSILFVIGLLGVALNRKNILTTIMSIELLLLSVNINFVALSVYLDDIVGHIFVLFILSVTAAESAIGLSILYNLTQKEIASIKKSQKYSFFKNLNKLVMFKLFHHSPGKSH